jgi:hypothetical protein
VIGNRESAPELEMIRRSRASGAVAALPTSSALEKPFRDRLIENYTAIAVTLTDLHLFSTKHLPERCTAVALQTVGLDRQAANEIARRPLPS